MVFRLFTEYMIKTSISIAAVKATKMNWDDSTPNTSDTIPAKQLENKRPSLPIVKTRPDEDPPSSGLVEVTQAINVGNIGARKKPNIDQLIILKLNGNDKEAKIIHTKDKPEDTMMHFSYPVLSTIDPHIRRPIPINPQNKLVVKPASKTAEPELSNIEASHVLTPISVAM